MGSDWSVLGGIFVESDIIGGECASAALFWTREETVGLVDGVSLSASCSASTQQLLLGIVKEDDGADSVRRADMGGRWLAVDGH